MDEHFEVIELGPDRIVRTGCEVIYYLDGDIEIDKILETEDLAREMFSSFKAFQQIIELMKTRS